jgi:hypothetical protein
MGWVGSGCGAVGSTGVLGYRTLLFGTNIDQLDYVASDYMVQRLTPAVPYVYTCPSGGGCFCAASAMGFDILEESKLIRAVQGSRSCKG